MKKVTKFEANDGIVFDTEQAALTHDNLQALSEWYEDHKLQALSEWYEDHKLYGMCEGCRIEWDDFIEWCGDNKDKLKEILAAC